MIEAASGQRERFFPAGTFKEVYLDLRDRYGNTFTIGEFIHRSSVAVRQHVPDLPPHLISIAWQIAILRDHVYDLDSGGLEEVARELVENDIVFRKLSEPSVIAFLDNPDNRSQLFRVLQETFPD